jgi:hypothetical protein
MKKEMLGIGIFLVFVLSAGLALAAYHHQDEMDADKFLAIYPDKAGTKLDHCALCHSGEVVSGATTSLTMAEKIRTLLRP